MGLMFGDRNLGKDMYMEVIIREMVFEIIWKVEIVCIEDERDVQYFEEY